MPGAFVAGAFVMPPFMVDHRSTGLPGCGPTESSAPEPCYICIYFFYFFFNELIQFYQLFFYKFNFRSGEIIIRN